jgi:hypothetical protein
MPLVGFEPTTRVFERATTIHALDCAATVIGTVLYKSYKWYNASGFPGDFSP